MTGSKSKWLLWLKCWIEKMLKTGLTTIHKKKHLETSKLYCCGWVEVSARSRLKTLPLA